jgi:leucyl-tRNA synthetase
MRTRTLLLSPSSSLTLYNRLFSHSPPLIRTLSPSHPPPCIACTQLVLEPYPEGSPLRCPALAGKKVFLAPATLRPETMYGQTNCFVLPEGDYGAYEVVGGDVLIISDRAARGLAHQSLTPEWGVAPSLVNLKGSDLLGLPLKAPNATYERVYTLPLMTISMGKGTGVVTSVPSDAPDDYAALKELKDKPLWREKFGLTAEMVDPFEVVPIIG